MSWRGSEADGMVGGISYQMNNINKSLSHYPYTPRNLKVVQIDTASSEVIICVTVQVS